MGDPAAQGNTAPSGSMHPPQTPGGDAGPAPPTPAEARWAALVGQLRLLFHMRRYWAGLGTYLKNFTALR